MREEIEPKNEMALVWLPKEKGLAQARIILLHIHRKKIESGTDLSPLNNH
jgi:hypothetical protein